MGDPSKAEAIEPAEGDASALRELGFALSDAHAGRFRMEVRDLGG